MSKKLILVENNRQAAALQALFPQDRVVALGVALVELPADHLGVNLDQDFALNWQIIPSKTPLLTTLRTELDHYQALYLATAPTPAGEFLAQQVLDCLGVTPLQQGIYRVWLNKLDPASIMQAFRNPRPLNEALIDTYLTQRTRDRLVSYLLAPSLTQQLDATTGVNPLVLTALALLAERETQVQSMPTRNWTLWGQWRDNLGECQSGLLQRVNGDHLPETPHALYAELQQVGAFTIAQRQVRRCHIQATPPHSLATLVAECVGNGFTVPTTLTLLNQLYEKGWISYPFTASSDYPPTLQRDLRTYLSQIPQANLIPLSASTLPTDAVAIYPLRPERPLVGLNPEQARVYTLIRQNALAAQTQTREYPLTVLNAVAGADWQVTLVIQHAPDADPLGCHQVGQTLQDIQWSIRQSSPQTLTRYTAGQFLEALADLAVPAEHLTVLLETLTTVGYARLEVDQTLWLTPLGHRLLNFLAPYCGEIFAPATVRAWYAQLAQVQSGKLGRVAVLTDFWGSFKPALKALNKDTLRLIQYGQPLVEACPQCGGRLHQRRGGAESLVVCEHFPRDCTYSVGKRAPLVLRELPPLEGVAS